jgi:hypothetical protein
LLITAHTLGLTASCLSSVAVRGTSSVLIAVTVSFVLHPPSHQPWTRKISLPNPQSSWSS